MNEDMYSDAAKHEQYHRRRTDGEACEDTRGVRAQGAEDTERTPTDEEVARYEVDATPKDNTARRARSDRIARDNIETMKQNTQEALSREEEETRIREMKEKMKRLAGTNKLGGDYDTPPQER